MDRHFDCLIVGAGIIGLSHALAASRAGLRTAVLNIPEPRVSERWTGLYPPGPDIAFRETPMAGVRLVMVTSGTGASTGFAIGEETIASLLGRAPPPHEGDA